MTGCIMARESRTKYAVLGLLNLGPKCGYDIKKELEQSSMFFWNESYGQIYPMLKKLVSTQLATLEVVERDDQPDMKVYTITPQGQQELERWLKKPADVYPVRNEMLLKLFFGEAVDRFCNVEHIERLSQALLQQAEDFKHQRELIDSGEASSLYLSLTLRYGELVNDAVRQWCKEAQQALDEGEE